MGVMRISGFVGRHGRGMGYPGRIVDPPGGGALRAAGMRTQIPFARAAGAPAEETIQIKTFDPGAEEIIWVRP